MKSNPLLSVCLITYNHEKYIRNALDGIIAQKTNFPIEVVVSDDLSKDNTKSIIDKYAQNHPETFLVLNNKENLGMHKNWERAIRACNGTYVALLEGDDYWIDKYKLQKQVDILEHNNEIVISFTNATIINTFNKKESKYVYEEKEILSLHDLLKNNFIPTCTAVFKKEFLDDLPDTYYQSPYVDWLIHISIAKKGQIHFKDKITSCYLMHENGVYSGSNYVKKLVDSIKTNKAILAFIPEDKEGKLIIKINIFEAIKKLKYAYLKNQQHVSYYKILFKEFYLRWLLIRV